MSLVPSLLQAIVQLDGEALVMHVGDKPYVVSPTGQVDLATRGLSFEAVVGVVNQLLPIESQQALDEFGAAQYELPPVPEFPGEHFTIVAARGGDDVWAEVRRRRVTEDDRVPMEFFADAPAPAPEYADVAPVPEVEQEPDSVYAAATSESDLSDLAIPSAGQLFPPADAAPPVEARSAFDEVDLTLETEGEGDSGTYEIEHEWTASSTPEAAAPIATEASVPASEPPVELPPPAVHINVSVTIDSAPAETASVDAIGKAESAIEPQHAQPTPAHAELRHDAPVEPPLASHVEPAPAAPVEPIAAAHTDPIPVAHVEPMPVARVEAPPVEHAAAHIEPIAVAHAEPIPVAHVEAPPIEHAEPPSAVHVEPIAVAHVEPIPVAHVEAPPVEHAEPPSAVHVEPVAVAHVEPIEVAHVEPIPVAHVEAPPVEHVEPPSAVHVEPIAVAHVESAPVAHVEPPVPAHVEPPSAVYVEPIPVAHAEPIAVAHVETPEVVHIEPAVEAAAASVPVVAESLPPASAPIETAPAPSAAVEAPPTAIQQPPVAVTQPPVAVTQPLVSIEQAPVATARPPIAITLPSEPRVKPPPPPFMTHVEAARPAHVEPPHVAQVEAARPAHVEPPYVAQVESPAAPASAAPAAHAPASPVHASAPAPAPVAVEAAATEPSRAPLPVAHAEPAPHVEAPRTAHIEPVSVAHVEPPPVAHIEPAPVAHIEPAPVPHVEAPRAAHIEPVPVAHIEPPPVAHTEPPPVSQPVAQIEPPVARVEPSPIAHIEPPPVAYVEPPMAPAAPAAAPPVARTTPVAAAPIEPVSPPLTIDTPERFEELHMAPPSSRESFASAEEAPTFVPPATESGRRVVQTSSADTWQPPTRPSASPQTPPPDIRFASAAQGVVLPLSRSAIRPDAPPPLGDQALAGLDRLLRLAAARGASTLYLSSASRPSVRVDGDIHVLEGAPVLSPNDVESLLITLMPERSAEALRTGVASEWICELPDVGRVRCMSFRDHRGPGGVFRMMPSRAVTAEQLGLSREIQALAIEPEGLLLVSGPRSSGKRTLISALVDLINRTRRDHVISIESEINVVHERSGSFISQREVRGGIDEMVTVARAALREDPDILILEELRSPALMNVALDAAGAGQLVIGGFPAHSATSAVDRIIDLYPPEHRRQVQLSLAMNLRGVVAQVLLRKNTGGRVAAREVLLNTPAVASVLAEGKTSQLPLTIEGGRRQGMVPLNDALVGFVQSGVVDVREAYRRAADRAGFLALLKRQGVDTSVIERYA